MDISLHYGYYFERLFLQSPDLEQKISLEDRNHLAAALEECTSIDLDVLFQRYFKLSYGATQSSIKASPSTMTKIYNLLDKWINKEGNNATYRRVNSILDEAKLIGIKQLWWIKYRDTLEQDSFEEHRSMISEKVFCLSDCPVTENEWNCFMTELSKNFKLKCSENDSRVDFLNRWLERRGYEVPLDELREALKKTRLRRFVYKLIDLAQDKQSEMGKCFIDYMEDQFDDQLSKLTDEEKEYVYRALRPDDPPTAEDEAFDAILIDGNRGFNRFYKALLSHDKCDIAKVFGKNCNGISNIKEPNNLCFRNFSACRDMSETLQIKRFLRLYGPKGSGKSVCSYIFAQTFIQENLLSVVWFVDCTDDNSVSQSITSFNKELYGAGISLQDGSGPVVIKQLVDDLKCHELPVLLVLDNVKMLYQQCKDLFGELKTYEKSIVVEISVEEESLTAHNFPTQEILGFDADESRQFLNPSDDQFDAAMRIAKDCNHLPLELALVKAYCEDEENQLSYIEYLDLIEKPEDRCIVQQWKKNTGLNRVLEYNRMYDIAVVGTRRTETLQEQNIIQEIKEWVEEEFRNNYEDLHSIIKEQQDLIAQQKIDIADLIKKLSDEDLQKEKLKVEQLNHKFEEEHQLALEWKRKYERCLDEKNRDREKNKEKCKVLEKEYQDLLVQVEKDKSERERLQHEVEKLTVRHSLELSAAPSGVSSTSDQSTTSSGSNVEQLRPSSAEQATTRSRSNIEQTLLKSVFLAIEKNDSAQLYYMKILRHVLELSVPTIDVIDEKHDEPSFKLMRGLSKWKAREGLKATPQRLADKLGENGLRDVQEEVLKIISGETAEDLERRSNYEDVHE